jgi:hypothetical protein
MDSTTWRCATLERLRTASVLCRQTTDGSPIEAVALREEPQKAVVH